MSKKQRYEHKTIFVQPEHHDRQLRKWEREGWELCAATNANAKECFLLYFKRPKSTK